jgi:hypothetical protein
MKRSTKTTLTAGTSAILLGLTSLINGLQASKRESCVLKVDYAHISTYAYEADGVKKLKIKAKTECNRPQKYSTVTMRFYEVTLVRKKEVWVSESIIESADKKRPENAYFESFEKACNNSERHNYLGKATGKVRMKSGKLIKVSGKSEKYISLPCGFVAQ